MPEPRATIRRAVSSLRMHPAAAQVPAMSEAEFAALCADIAKHGIEQPLEITRNGLVLDGRHRLRAARELGIARVSATVVDPDDPVAYVLRSAVQRRHLSASQKAALALNLALYQDERDRARKRQRANLKHSE